MQIVVARSRPSVQQIIDFATELDSVCTKYGSSCYFSISRSSSYSLSEVKKLPKSLLRGQFSWFEIVFNKPPLGLPNLRDWMIHPSEIGDISPDLETVFTEKLLNSTFTLNL